MTQLACLAYILVQFQANIQRCKTIQKTTLIILKGKESENMDKFSKDSFS